MTESEWQPARWNLPTPTGFEEVPGLYRVLTNGAAEARVHGTTGGMPGMVHDLFDSPPPLMHGRLMNGVVTLVDTSGIKSNSGLSPLQDVTLEPRYAIEGEQVEVDQLALTLVEVVFTNQDEWTWWSVYQPVDDAEHERGLRVRYVQPPTYRASFPGVELRLVDNSSPSTSAWPHEWRFRSASRFMLEFEKATSIDAILNEWLPPLLLMLSLASGQSVGVKSMKGTNSDWPSWRSDDPSTKWTTVRVSRPDPPRRPRPAHEYLHRLNDFDFSRQVVRLFKSVEKCRYATFRTLSLWERSSPSHVEDFVRTLQVAEALGRALHPEIDSAKAIMDKLNQDTGRFINDLWGNGAWTEKIRILRDVATHSFESANDFMGDVRALQGATVMLSMLLEARWLVAFGFTAEEARDLLRRRPRYGWQVTLIKNTRPLLQGVKKK